MPRTCPSRTLAPAWMLALAAVALAGCAGSGGDAKADAPALGEGVLPGVVVDDAVRPVAGAAVRLPALGQEMQTDTDGAFRFDGLPDGVVALEVEADGYLPATLTVDVRPGMATVKVVLERSLESLRYASAYVFDGFVDCGTGHFAACGAPFAVQTILCGNGGPCTDNVTDGRFIAFHSLDGLPAHVQSELVWESTQPFGDSLVMIQFASTPEEKAAFGGRQLNETVGPSPVLNIVTGEQAAESGLGVNSSLAIGVYGGKYCGVPGVCHENVGLVVQQRFRIVTHAFYGYVPPPDWRFSADGTVPAPPA